MSHTPASASAREMGRKTAEMLFSRIGSQDDMGRKRKVTVVGAGAVGLAAAYAIINQGLCSELALVDVMTEKVIGEAMDLQHGAAHMKRCTIKGGSNYDISANSDLVIITAGARQREGESRLDLVGRNLQIFNGIVPEVVKYSPKCTICVVSNPVDVMTFVTQKLSGFPLGRVFGSGTALDSSRFRTMIADRLGVDARSVHGSIIGEHGDSSVACWSNLNVAGVRLRDVNPVVGRVGQDPENWEDVHVQVVQSAYEIIKAKGFTNWGIGMTCASIAECVLRDEHRVIPVSVPVQGRYDIPHKDVYLSLPAVLGADGVRDILTPPLDESETASLRKSADAIAKVQDGLNWEGVNVPAQQAQA